ncbi:four helix bundle protein [Bacteroidota bacterium]
MTEKEIFIQNFKKRTKKFAVDVILFCDSLKKCSASSVITYQLIKSASSTGANYRAACRARSKSEFFSKVCIVVEEADESEFWLEIIHDTNLTSKVEELNRLTKEANEITKIMTKAKNSSYSGTK